MLISLVPSVVHLDEHGVLGGERRAVRRCAQYAYADREFAGLFHCDFPIDSYRVSRLEPEVRDRLSWTRHQLTVQGKKFLYLDNANRDSPVVDELQRIGYGSCFALWLSSYFDRERPWTHGGDISAGS